MKNKSLYYVGIGILVVLLIVIISFVRKPNANSEVAKQVETPPQIQKVNDIPLSQRPFVQMLIRPAEKNCEGMDLMVSNFHSNETNFDYFMEYETQKGLIEVINGNRDLIVEKTHDPLLFGTCSSGACTCQKVVDGSLKLTFSSANGEYVLKNDFVYANVGDKKGIIKSKDLRLTLDIGTVLANRNNVLIGSSFGLPGELNEKVVLGPYYISSYGVDKLSKTVKAFFQTKDSMGGKVQFWNGENWKEIPSTVEGEKLSFEIDQFGTIVLTE